MSEIKTNLDEQGRTVSWDIVLHGRMPECYLHVRECRSGQEWIMPMRGNASLNLKHQVKRWVRAEYGGELRLDGELMPRLDGDYYARIMTDGREPDSVVCWTSGGFYLKGTEA